jgi:hypothetical protein
MIDRRTETGRSYPFKKYSQLPPGGYPIAVKYIISYTGLGMCVYHLFVVSMTKALHIIIIIIIIIVIIIIKLWSIQQIGHAGTTKNIARKLPRMRQFKDREDGKNNIKIHIRKMCGRDSVLGIATSFQLQGVGFETPVERGACPTRPDRPLMRTQTPVR